KAKCHREACYWALPPTPLNDPPKESFGKGMTVEQSMASGMMEAIERYCGQRFPHHEVINTTYEMVLNHAVNPSEFNLPTLPLKCENCTEANTRCFQDLSKVSQEWSWGYSLTKEKPTLIPSSLVYYPYISNDKTSFVFNDTGGLSAGNTVEEAILQGIAEVIERDALYYCYNLGNLRNMPLLNFKDVRNRYVREFSEKLPSEAIFAIPLNNENVKLGVTTFSAFICYITNDERVYFGGSGTSLDPEVGLLRALTELEQQKVRQKTFVEFDRKDLLLQNDIRAEDTISIGNIGHQSTKDIKDDIELYLDALAKHNMDVIVVNLTHPHIGMPVVRVIIPELISYSGSVIKESVLFDVIRAYSKQK
ncbi:MAG: YcaO-like family protein, partial [Deltaproteobacteria bacterium]|nr:YcaO-like family protein [Deltaproteobacteria bacterium]